MAKECGSTTCDKTSCEGCSQKDKPQSFLAELNIYSEVKHVIGVVSGKGGVGKSFVTGSPANDGVKGIPCRNYGCGYYGTVHPQNVWTYGCSPGR